MDLKVGDIIRPEGSMYEGVEDLIIEENQTKFVLVRLKVNEYATARKIKERETHKEFKDVVSLGAIFVRKATTTEMTLYGRK